MIAFKSIAGLALTVLFSACAPRVVVETPTAASVVVSPQPTRALVNERLNLPTYPGSTLLKYENKRDGSSEANFQSAESLERIYGFFHSTLSNNGWNRIALEAKFAATKVEASYLRNGVRFKLNLDQEGRSGRYKMEIEF